jgi:hypothetical protein
MLPASRFHSQVGCCFAAAVSNAEYSRVAGCIVKPRADENWHFVCWCKGLIYSELAESKGN